MDKVDYLIAEYCIIGDYSEELSYLAQKYSTIKIKMTGARSSATIIPYLEKKGYKVVF